MNCPRCQQEISETSAFCPYCGQKVIVQSLCRKAKYCVNCGRVCVGADPMCAECREKNRRQKEKFNAKSLKYTLIILLVAITLAATVFLGHMVFYKRDGNDISIYQTEKHSFPKETEDNTLQQTTNAVEEPFFETEITTIPKTEEHKDTTFVEPPTTEAPSTVPTTAPPTTEIPAPEPNSEALSTEEEYPESTETPSPVTLNFWQAGGDDNDAAYIMRLLLDKFELMYPWITVNYQAIPWSHDPHTQFQTAITDGNCADVLVVGQPLDFQLAGEGNLLPLDDMLGSEVLNDMSDIVKRECVYRGNENTYMQGKIMSVPLYGGARVMLYNKEIFDYFGVSYPTEGMSHEDLLEMAKKLTGDVNGKKVYGYGTRATTSEQYLNFVWNYGAKIIDPSTMTPGTDSMEWKKGIEDYLAFYEAGVVPEGAVGLYGTDLLNMFLNGEVAMFIAAYDYAVEITQTKVEGGETPWADKLGVAPLVGETYATCYCGADLLVVPSTTQNATEAGLLVKYLMSTEAQAMYARSAGFFPFAKSASYESQFSNDNILFGYASAMQGSHFFDNYGVPGVGTILKEELQALIMGESTIEEYQANQTERISAKIREQNAY